MVLANGAAAPVRQTAETAANRAMPHKPERVEASSADFERALAAALAPLADQLFPGPRRRAEAVARAQSQILAAAEALVKAERRKTVAALTPAQLRKEVRELLDSHTQLLDYIDDLERWPVIAAEVRRLRARGEIPWPL